MSAKILTAEQRAAVEAEGETLVSASAGSGKTFVMIEKIISLILEGKAQISGVLAVTFTNLAAAEMKEKLKRAIVGRINEETDEGVKSRLKYELSEIGASDICTLHSFCANLIRRYFYVTDENGDFQIADDADASEMKNRAAEIATGRAFGTKERKIPTVIAAVRGQQGFKAAHGIIFAPLRKDARARRLPRAAGKYARALYRRNVSFDRGYPLFGVESPFNAVARARAVAGGGNRIFRFRQRNESQISLVSGGNSGAVPAIGKSGRSVRRGGSGKGKQTFLQAPQRAAQKGGKRARAQTRRAHRRREKCIQRDPDRIEGVRKRRGRPRAILSLGGDRGGAVRTSARLRRRVRRR